MTNVVNEKYDEIERSKIELQKLKHLLERKKRRAWRKNRIIKILEDEDNSCTDESDDADSFKDENIDYYENQKRCHILGSGHFVKELIVRDGMEEAADSLGDEWKSNIKQKWRKNIFGLRQETYLHTLPRVVHGYGGHGEDWISNMCFTCVFTCV